MINLTLFACSPVSTEHPSNEGIEEENEDQVPVYLGMSVASEPTCGKDLGVKTAFARTKYASDKDITIDVADYYADLSEKVYIHVHIENPRNFEILSFTLNGVKYSSYMFEEGSDMQTIILKCDVGRESGLKQYTIDAIKYIDGSAIKDVKIRGNKTVNIIVSEYEHEDNCKHDNPDKITVLAGKDATCDLVGLTEGKKCELCNTVILPQVVVPKLECTPGEWIVDKEATTTEDGLLHTECTACGKLLEEKTVDSISSSGLAYSVNEDNISCTVTGIGMCQDLDVIIPKHIDGYKVTAIAEGAFAECRDITSVYISDFVTEIGKIAFGSCTSLINVSFPASLKIIGDSAFGSCNAVENVYYRGDVEGWCSIDFVTGWSNPSGYGTQLYFNGELVTNLIIPDTVTKIDNHAFFGCESLTSVVIGDGVTVIEDQAFSSCRSLVDITIGKSVKVIEDCAFERAAIESIVIPDSVEYIGCETFYYCESLKNVVIGKSVSYVHVGAFLGALSVEYTEFENALYLGNEENPYHLLVSIKNKTITSFDVPESTRAIVSATFESCSSLERVTLPNGLTNIGWRMFSGCSNLTNVVIPDTVTFIDESAFDYCLSLTSVNIPDSVTKIGSSAFGGCASLANVIIPDGVTEIGDYAFSGCASLVSINIPASVISIGASAFGNCTSLQEINVDENNEYYQSIDGNLYSKDGKTLINYASAKQDTTFNIPEFVTCVAKGAFSGSKSLVTVLIPHSVMEIGSSAFYNCSSLVNIMLPDSITEIASSTFYNCTSLVSITLPDSITSIGSFAFSGCTSLTSIIIPDSITSIGDRAFMDCTSLSSVYIPDTVTKLDYSPFYGCHALTIYCEAKSKPSSWDSSWNRIYNYTSQKYYYLPVVWGYTGV